MSPNENESERIAALEKYKILEADEHFFDDVVYIAAQICQTPMAAVALIDRDKAWYKSTIGFDSIGIKRENIFCNHVIHQNDVFEAPDANKFKHLLADAKCLDDLDIQFYAGVALIDKHGYALGTLCVMDHKPRKLNYDQMKALKALSNQVMNMVELKHAKEELDLHSSEQQLLMRLSAVQQERMIQSARLSSLGEMAAGVAHEINNPLAVIDHGVVKMHRKQKCDNATIASIEKAIQRITTIISNLRAYGRDAEKDPMEKIGIKNLLENTLELYRSRAKEEGIELKLVSDETHFVEARQTQIAQILFNLVQNSFQAIRKNETKWIKVESHSQLDDICIEISDSGLGIPASYREKIFDPFFTTKNSPEGIGLGLSTSRRLAESNGGCLYLDTSSVNTKFVLKLRKEAKIPFQEYGHQSPDLPQLAS